MSRLLSAILSLTLLAQISLGVFIAVPRTIEFRGKLDYTMKWNRDGVRYIDFVIDDPVLTRGIYFRHDPLGILMTVKESDQPEHPEIFTCKVWGFDPIFVPDCYYEEQVNE